MCEDITVVFLSLIRIIQCKYWILLGEASCAGRQVPPLCNTSSVEHPPGLMLKTESIRSINNKRSERNGH